ncbi:MAG TPA: response regulator [Bacteroidetes bacterium]|nr:cyclic di-GMP phosphodiesterase response regulator RpfG [bacterium BMS3Bbin04]HDO64778.1 response regulator [Bacteroidota bacterium]HEX03903.1 response regulator [Bacteroidota bacterium]
MIHTPRILVAEDETDTRSVLGQMLEALGYDALLTDNGRAAFDSMADNPPDLVLSDVMMPIMDGFELCQRIKSDPTTRLVPVVLLTGLGGVEDRVRGIDAGADDFISKPFQLTELHARIRSLLRLKQFTDDLEHAESIIFSLARTVEAKDAYTEDHCNRLSVYSVIIGQRLGLDEEDQRALRRGGILHDIGKISIADAILLKPGPLSQEERDIMQTHSVRGETICKPLRSLHSSLPIIRHHHERMDGTGYPDHLSGEDIPLNARIVAAVDFIDALVTERPYRGPLPMKEALRMANAAAEDGHLDPQIVKLVEELIDGLGREWTTGNQKMNGY